MNWNNDIHHKRARVGTSIFAVLLLLFIFFFGLTYINPPPEDGIAINFGYEDEGSGNTSTSEQSETPVEQTEPTPPVETPDPVVNDVVTQDLVDAPDVNTEKKPELTEEQKKKIEQEKIKQREIAEQERKRKELEDRLKKNSDVEDASKKNGDGDGEGDKKGGGDQGDPDGDPNSKNRDGNGGIGNSGDYRLGGRKALSRPIPEYDCSAEGRVVVKVYVNRSGKVVNAVPGEAISGGPASTTADGCLLKRAKEAALKTTWQGDANATDQQIGYIIYNFRKN